MTLWVIALVLPEARARCSRTITAVLPPQAERASALVATALSAYSAAVCGALCQLFVKVVAVTLHEAGGNFACPHSPWRALPPYLALLGLVLTAPLQLYLLDPRAYYRCSDESHSSARACGPSPGARG